MTTTINEFEQILCGVEASGSLELVMPRSADAWDLQFPDLTSLCLKDAPLDPLRICIATEDIAGPVRNGGIGTTYAALAALVAELGHEVTILYLRGQDVETGTIEHWIDHYAERNIKFVPVPDYATQDRIRTNSDRWLRAPYNMMRYLQQHPMDVVHVSEWRGSGYLCLLAKQQGVAFAETLFLVKTSSPWMWNRLYGAHTLDRVEDLAKVNAERQSVELADMVIGGSLHLLRWMASQGYRLARDRTFVQPNVVSLQNLENCIGRTPSTGERVHIDEIVFFGRLEGRKGLFIFCQAIKRLIRMGIVLPKVSFMGKLGARLAARPDQSVLDYLRSETRSWPTDVQILTEFQQTEAINYLLSGDRLAVMPSLIENSSLAVYEATICGIPCIASNVGGNSELVHPDDAVKILCEPNPRALGDKIKEAVEHGALIPRPSFSNDANLKTWRRFHRALSGELQQALLSKTRVARTKPLSGTTTILIYSTGDEEALSDTLASIRAQKTAPFEVLIAVDAEQTKALPAVRRAVQNLWTPTRIMDASDLDAGGAFTTLAQQAGGDALLFLWEGATLTSNAIGDLATVASSSGADVLTYFYHQTGADQGDALKMGVIGSVSEAFFSSDTSPLPLFVKRSVFGDLGGFSSDYRVLNFEHEFIAKAQLHGCLCQTAMLTLGAVPVLTPSWLAQRGYDLEASAFRVIRPQLAAAPLAQRDLLLAGRGKLSRSEGVGKKSKPTPSKPRDQTITSILQIMINE